MKKDFSKFKVVGLLLVAMSSCVAGSFELNAETLQNYGFELDVVSLTKKQSATKQKKNKSTSYPKITIENIIESGRTIVTASRISVDNIPVLFCLRDNHYFTPLINKRIDEGSLIAPESYVGVNFQSRAGPSCL